MMHCSIGVRGHRKRANLSRTLLYRIFKDKEEIYQAVFVDWLISRHPASKPAAEGPGSRYERLLSVRRLMALEPRGRDGRRAHGAGVP